MSQDPRSSLSFLFFFFFFFFFAAEAICLRPRIRAPCRGEPSAHLLVSLFFFFFSFVIRQTRKGPQVCGSDIPPVPFPFFPLSSRRCSRSTSNSFFRSWFPESIQIRRAGVAGVTVRGFSSFFPSPPPFLPPTKAEQRPPPAGSASCVSFFFFSAISPFPFPDRRRW